MAMFRQVKLEHLWSLLTAQITCDNVTTLDQGWINVFDVGPALTQRSDSHPGQLVRSRGSLGRALKHKLYHQEYGGQQVEFPRRAGLRIEPRY